MKNDTMGCSQPVLPSGEAKAKANVFGRIKKMLICWNCGEELWADAGERLVTCTHCGSLVSVEDALP